MQVGQIEKHDITVQDSKGVRLHVTEGTAFRGRCDKNKKMKTHLKGAPVIKNNETPFSTSQGLFSAGRKTGQKCIFASTWLYLIKPIAGLGNRDVIGPHPVDKKIICLNYFNEKEPISG